METFEEDDPNLKKPLDDVWYVSQDDQIFVFVTNIERTHFVAENRKNTLCCRDRMGFSFLVSFLDQIAFNKTFYFEHFQIVCYFSYTNWQILKLSPTKYDVTQQSTRERPASFGINDCWQNRLQTHDVRMTTQ